MSKSARRLTAALLAFCLLCLCGCVDLGDYAGDDGFYDTLGEIYFISPDTPPTDLIFRQYGIRDITNKATQEATKTDHPETAADETATVMPEDHYKYVVFEIVDDTVLVEKNADGTETRAPYVIDDMCLWFLPNASFSGRVTAEIYVSDKDPTGMKSDADRALYAGCYTVKDASGFTDEISFDGYGKAYDAAGNQGLILIDTTDNGVTTLVFNISRLEGLSLVNTQYTCVLRAPYDTVTVTKNDGTSVVSYEYTYTEPCRQSSEADLTQDRKVATVTTTAKGGEWNSFFVENFTVVGESRSSIYINKGSFVYIKILNNCFGASRNGLSPIAFRANNLMLRAQKV